MTMNQRATETPTATRRTAIPWVAQASHGGLVLAVWTCVGVGIVGDAHRRMGDALWEDLGRRVLDFQLAATVLLAAVAIAQFCCRDALVRLSTSTAGLVGLTVLGVASLIPALPRHPLPWSEPWSRLGTHTLAVNRTADSDSLSAHKNSARPTASQSSRQTPLRATASRAESVRTDGLAFPHNLFSAAAADFGDGAWFEWLGKLYLVGTAAAMVWLASGAARVAGVVARSRPAPSWVDDALRRVTGREDSLVRALITPELDSAAAVGGLLPTLWRPAILLPERCLAERGLNPPGTTNPAAQLDAVLAHEWSHIRRGDLFRMALARALWVPLFAHPLYWWLRRSQRLDQELLADGEAVAASGMAATEYAGLLLEWAKRGPTRFDWAAEMLGIGHRSSHLSRRVAVLLADRKQLGYGTRWLRRCRFVGVLAAVALAGALSLATISQPSTAWAERGSANRLDRGRQSFIAFPESTPKPEDYKPEQELPGKARRQAVALAVGWLVRHQQADGGWRFSHGAGCPDKQADGAGACDGEGNAKGDTASTGLALLALMAAGHAPGVEGPHRSSLDRGVEWLVWQQADDGRLFAQGGSMYNHGIATLALCEAYYGSRDKRLEKPAQRAIDFIVRAQDKNGGGWRYQPGMPGDTSVFGWQLLALRSGQQARLKLEAATLEAARGYLNSVNFGPNSEFYAYVPANIQANPGAALTAVGTLSKQLLGAAPDDKSVVKGLDAVASVKPDIGPQRDCYRWFFAAQAIDRSNDNAERIAWQTALSTQLVRTQEREGCKAGSWSPANPAPDRWATIGGRLMVTTLSTIALSAEERRLAVFKTGRNELN